MAKVLFTAIVADMRNKLNGTVFAKNRYGNYTRTKVTPVNPQTTSQQANRNILATNAAAWRGLTEAQRQGWINATPSFPFTDIFGQSRILAGNTLYTKLNNNLALIGQSLISDAPSPVALPSLDTLSVTAADGTPAVSVVFSPTPIPAGFNMIIQATPCVGAGINFVKSKFRNVSVIAAAGTSPVNLLSNWSAMFGSPVAGQKIFVRAFLVSTTTGQAGIPLQASCIVAA